MWKWLRCLRQQEAETTRGGEPGMEEQLELRPGREDGALGLRHQRRGARPSHVLVWGRSMASMRPLSMPPLRSMGGMMCAKGGSGCSGGQRVWRGNG